MSHVFHERDPDQLPILFDDCPGCDRHASGKGLTLDAGTFGLAWRRMIAVEGPPSRAADGTGPSHALSNNEKRLLADLYYFAVLLERHFGINPWRPIEEIR